MMYILLAVVLIAALTAALSRGGNVSHSSLSGQQTKIAAQEIIDYGNTVASAVQKLRLRGCAETQISFQNSTVAGYTNGTNTSCQVFHKDGGALSWKTPPAEFLNSAFSASAGYGTYIINGSNCVPDVGTDAAGAGCAPPELIIMLPYIRDEIRTEINSILSAPAGLSDSNSVWIGTKFQGVYQDYAGFDQHAGFTGRIAGAAYIGGGSGADLAPNGSNVYFQVLLAR